MSDQQKENLEDQENLVEVEETVVEKEETFDTEGLLPGEVKMAKEHGLIKEEKEKEKKEEKKEDVEHKEQPDTETKEDTGAEEDKTEETKEDEVDKDPDTFEDIDKVFTENEDKFHKTYTSNQKALYFKHKNERKKRQEAVKELEEVKAQYELNQVKDIAASSKLQKISEALNGEVTIEQLQSIISGGQRTAEAGDDKPITKADLDKIEADKKVDLEAKQKLQKKFQDRVNVAEQIGKSKYDNFDNIVKLAQKVVAEDKDGTYQEVLNRAFMDDNLTEEQLISKVITIAKISPKFGELNKSVKPEEKDKVDKAIINSKKKVSSAAIGSSGGKRKIAEDDLTPDDMEGMSTAAWMKLSDKTRERLLGKPS